MKHNIVATVIVLLAIYFTRATDPQDDSDDDVVVNNNNETNIEVLPEAVAWTDAPMCPMWGPMESFYQEGIEKGRYLGRWWLQDKYSELSDMSGRCRSQVYSVNYVNQTIHRQTDYQSIIGNFHRSETGQITFQDISDANLLEYTSKKGSGPEQEYRVLATDYETFTIEYTCQDSNLIKGREQVWIYTRDRRPSNEVLKRAYKSLKILGLNGWKLKKADQSCKEANTIGTMSIRRNFEVDGHRGAGGRSGHRISKKSGLVGGGGRSAAPEDYDYYENNYRHQHHQPPPQPISTAELTSEMLGSGLKLAQSVLAPWTLHPVMGFERKHSESESEDFRRRTLNVGRRKRRRRRRPY